VWRYRVFKVPPRGFGNVGDVAGTKSAAPPRRSHISASGRPSESSSGSSARVTNWSSGGVVKLPHTH